MGQGNLCEDMVYNLGAYAEYLRIPASIVRYNTFELPEGFPPAQAAVLEPLVSVVHAQKRLRWWSYWLDAPADGPAIGGCSSHRG
jgi:L-iditol 2-dehydrogenase